MSVEIDELELESGDLVLFCSDGLNSMVPMDELKKVFEGSFGDLEDLADRLTQEANDRGGDDNITIVLVQKD